MKTNITFQLSSSDTLSGGGGLPSSPQSPSAVLPELCRCVWTHLVWAVSVRTVLRESLIHAATPSTHADISWTHTNKHGSVSAAYK